MDNNIVEVPLTIVGRAGAVLAFQTSPVPVSVQVPVPILTIFARVAAVAFPLNENEPIVTLYVTASKLPAKILNVLVVFNKNASASCTVVNMLFTTIGELNSLPLHVIVCVPFLANVKLKALEFTVTPVPNNQFP